MGSVDQSTHSPATALAPVFRAAGTGRGTWAMGSLFESLLAASESDGELGVSVVLQPPGTATPLHVHTHESEAFYLLEGTMTYRAGDETFHLGAGDFVYLPKAVPHAFRVTGEAPVRFVGLTVPGALLGLYDEVGVPATEHRLPGADGLPMDVEISRWNEVGPRYGLRVVGPPIPA
ncbi:hypothetical protein GCM10027446_05100 [Angustibacter peucedani]